MNSFTEEGRLHLDRAVIVEGRDDVSAVSAACDALIIPTHGFGITKETWSVIEKAYEEKGLIIMTDPDHAGDEIRRKLSERFPGSVQCYLAREDAVSGDDIGIENAKPEDIQSALIRALELYEAAGGMRSEGESDQISREVSISDLSDLGLVGVERSQARRAAACRSLGIGYCNSRTMVKRLRGFGIGYEELHAAVKQINDNK